MIETQKVSQSEKEQYSVKAIQGNKLTGTVQENKNVFDRQTEMLIDKYNALITAIMDGSAAAEIGAMSGADATTVQAVLTDLLERTKTAEDTLLQKVDKITGKGLSTHDYDDTQTHANKAVLDAIKTLSQSIVKSDPSAVPSVAAVVNYIQSMGGGDMARATYDTNQSGVVDDAQRLGGELPEAYVKFSTLGGANGAASLDETANVPEDELDNVAYLKDFYGRQVKRIEIQKTTPNEIIQYCGFNFKQLLVYPNSTWTSDGNITTSQITPLKTINNKTTFYTIHTAGSATQITPIQNYKENNIYMGPSRLSVSSENTIMTYGEKFDFSKIKKIRLKIGIIKTSSKGKFVITFGPRNDSMSYGDKYYIDNIMAKYEFTDAQGIGSTGGDITHYLELEIPDTLKKECNFGLNFKSENLDATTSSSLYIKEIVFISSGSTIYDFETKILTLDNGVLNGEVKLPVETLNPTAIDWHTLSAMYDTPLGTSIKYDIYDNYNTLLKEDVKPGDILKLAVPNIVIGVTMNRDSVDIKCPCLQWMEISMRGKDGQQTLKRKTKHFDTSNQYELCGNVSFNLISFCASGNNTYSSSGQIDTATDLYVHTTNAVALQTGNWLGYNIVKIHGQTSVNTYVRSNKPYDLSKIKQITIKTGNSVGTELRIGLSRDKSSIQNNFSIKKDQIKTLFSIDTSRLDGNYFLQLYINAYESVAVELTEINFIAELEEVECNNSLSLGIKDEYLTGQVKLPPFKIEADFVSWDTLSVMYDKPQGTNIRFDLLDPAGRVLKEDIKPGQLLKLAEPVIIPRITLTRESADIQSPSLQWLEVGMNMPIEYTGTWRDLGTVEILTEAAEFAILVPENINEIRIWTNNLYHSSTSGAGSTPFNIFINGDTVANNYRCVWCENTTVTTASSTRIGAGNFTCNVQAAMKIELIGLDAGQMTTYESSIQIGTQGTFGITRYNTDKVQKITMMSNAAKIKGTFEVWGR